MTESNSEIPATADAAADTDSAADTANVAVAVSPAGPAVRFFRQAARHRRLFILGEVVAIAVLAAMAWLLYSGFAARDELGVVRGDVQTLRTQISAGDLAAARVTARGLRARADEAHHLTSGPIWAAAAAVPFAGDPLDTVRAITASVSSIADDALPTLITASSELNPQTLHRPDGTFDLGQIASVAPSIDRASTTMKSALSDIGKAPSSTWLSAVNSGRSQLLDQLAPLTNTIANASVAADTVPELLGANGPRSYIVTFETEAELRGTGGLPGAFAIVKADHGRVTFTRFEPDSELGGVKSGLNFGDDYKFLYAPTAEPTDVYADSNVSPNFPYAARIWIAEWRVKTGQRLDGAMTLDPTSLSYLLDAGGSVNLADGTPVTAANVVDLTQRAAYLNFRGDDIRRRTYLLDIAQAVSQKLVSSAADTTALARAGGRAASEHRLLLWTSDAKVEARLAGTAISGVVPKTTAPYAGLAINSAVASKLDYYLHVSLDWTRTGCGATRTVTVTIRLTNDAPAGLPLAVLAGTTYADFPKPPGTNRLAVLFYATAGGGLDRVTLNGKTTTSRSGRERGHPVFAQTLYVPRGEPQTLVLHLREPAGSGSPITRMQPMIDPVQLTVHNATCGS